MEDEKLKPIFFKHGKPKEEEPKVIYVEQAPSNGLAAVLTFLLPGLGQLYQGRLFAAMFAFVFTVGGYAILFFPGLFFHLIIVIDALSFKK